MLIDFNEKACDQNGNPFPDAIDKNGILLEKQQNKLSDILSFYLSNSKIFDNNSKQERIRTKLDSDGILDMERSEIISLQEKLDTTSDIKPYMAARLVSVLQEALIKDKE